MQWVSIVPGSLVIYFRRTYICQAMFLAKRLYQINHPSGYRGPRSLSRLHSIEINVTKPRLKEPKMIQPLLSFKRIGFHSRFTTHGRQHGQRLLVSVYRYSLIHNWDGEDCSLLFIKRNSGLSPKRIKWRCPNNWFVYYRLLQDTSHSW